MTTKKNINPEIIYPPYDKTQKKPLPRLGGATSKTDFTKKIFQAIYILLRNSLFWSLEGTGRPVRTAPSRVQEIIIATEPFSG
ncbi:MAG: hypothetical protein R3D58_17385 [Saprospiraceae bacterium]|nr:hypothetical protein [Lewinellaceae bacterium]